MNGLQILCAMAMTVNPCILVSMTFLIFSSESWSMLQEQQRLVTGETNDRSTANLEVHSSKMTILFLASKTLARQRSWRCPLDSDSSSSSRWSNPFVYRGLAGRLSRVIYHTSDIMLTRFWTASFIPTSSRACQISSKVHESVTSRFSRTVAHHKKGS